MHDIISSSDMEKVKVSKDSVRSFFFRRRVIFYFFEKDDYLVVVFSLEGSHNGSNSRMKNKRKSVEIRDLVEGNETWVFIDTECKINRNMSFQWNQMFQYFLTRDYYMLLQDDLWKELSKDIYKNISKSELCKAAAKPLILLCHDFVEWMTINVYHSNKIILNFKGEHVASYQPYTIH